MLPKNFEVGDLVWAKMKNFPPWPGRIVDPPEDAKPRKGFHYVYFLGSENFAWMKDETINHHAQHLIPPASKKKTPLFQSAIDQIIELSKDRPFKVDKTVENTEDALVKVLPKSKSLEEEKSKISKRSSITKISKRRLSSKSSLENSESPKMRKFEGEGSSNQLDIIPRDLDISNHDISLITMYGERLSDSNAVTSKSDTKILEHVPPTSKKIGFLGLGTMGQAIVKKFLDSGHNVTVWNRTPGKCLDFIKAGADRSESPADVVKASDIIFCCVSDPNAVKSLVFGCNGVLKGLEDSAQAEGTEISKGYVEMTSIDFKTSIEISKAIEMKGGRYLAASLVGSKVKAEAGNLVILTSGNKELFSDCKACFRAISKATYYLGYAVSQSSQFSLAISTLMGTTFAAMVEALALAGRTKVSQYDLLSILQLKGFSCSEVTDRAEVIVTRKFNFHNTALKHQQKDMELTLRMSNEFSQIMPVTTAANELYKHAELLGYGDHDITALFYGAKY